MSSFDELWKWIAQSPLAAFVREAAWAYPLLETVHVVGLGLLVGAIVAFDMRLLGWNRDLPVTRLAYHLMAFVWIGFALNVVSGVLLFTSDAVELAANPALQVKLVLIVLAGFNALWFQWRIQPGAVAWNEQVRPPLAACAAALVSIGLWLAIIAAGRMIAYIK